MSNCVARRCVVLNHGFPVISFSFDDFPKSALHQGGVVLKRYGVAGTYYTSFGLMDHQDSPVGPIFARSDLEDLVTSGHELGCHTFSHCASWEVSGREFETSLLDNGRALNIVLPGTSFETMAYPFGCCSPWAKRVAAKYFSCCRGTDTGLNVGLADLNNLRSFPLERYGDNSGVLKLAITRNALAAGWLIFRTHDTSEQPRRGGCTLDFLEHIVRAAVESGARVMPIGQAWRVIRSHLFVNCSGEASRVIVQFAKPRKTVLRVRPH